MFNLTQLWIICTLIILIFHIGKVQADSPQAASPGDNFNDLMNSFCGTPPPELINLCSEFGGDSGSAGPGGAGGDNNLGVVGAQTQTSKTSATQLQEGIKERLDEQRDSKIELGLFVTLKNGEINRKETELENGYNADDQGVLIGVDHLFTDIFVAGAVLNYTKTDADFDDGSGTLKTNGLSATVFASYAASKNTYVDGYIGYGKLDFDNVRNIFNTIVPKQASSTTEGSQTLAGVNVHFGWPRGAWLFGSDIKIDYLKTEIDPYTEYSSKGNTDYLFTYPKQDIVSLPIAFGFNAAYNSPQTWGVFIPYIQLFYVHETENESRDITTGLAVAPNYTFITTTDLPDKDYWRSSFGASAVLPNDLQLFAELDLLTGNSFMDAWWINAGLRKQF